MPAPARAKRLVTKERSPKNESSEEPMSFTYSEAANRARNSTIGSGPNRRFPESKKPATKGLRT